MVFNVTILILFIFGTGDTVDWEGFLLMNSVYVTLKISNAICFMLTVWTCIGNSFMDWIHIFIKRSHLRSLIVAVLTWPVTTCMDRFYVFLELNFSKLLSWEGDFIVSSNCLGIFKVFSIISLISFPSRLNASFFWFLFRNK